MLLLKMPVEDTKSLAATPLKRVAPFEVLPLPQQTAAKTVATSSQLPAAATAGGLAPRRLLAERTEVSEQPITTCRTTTFGIALLVNDSSAFTVLVDLWALAVCACGCNCVGGRAVR